MTIKKNETVSSHHIATAYTTVCAADTWTLCSHEILVLTFLRCDACSYNRYYKGKQVTNGQVRKDVHPESLASVIRLKKTRYV